MAVTQACLNVQFLLQKLIQPPVLIDSSSLHCYFNPAYQKNSYNLVLVYPKLIFYSILLFVRIALIFSIFRIFWVLKFWSMLKSYEELAFYFILVTIAIIGIAAFDIYIKHPIRLPYVISQRFKLIKTFPQGNITHNL